MNRRFTGVTQMTPYNQDLQQFVECMEMNAMRNMIVKMGRDDNR